MQRYGGVVRRRESTPLLRVYVAGHCDGCAEALRIAKRVGRRFPALTVEVVDLGAEQTVADGVFAVPTWVLDGLTLSLGNPAVEAVERAIAAALSRRRKERT